MWTSSYSSSDQVVSGCQIYQPTLTWNKQDYEAICSHVTGQNSSHTIDTDSDGGRCSNYQALLAFEGNTNPDVWVNAKSFTWSPTSSSAGNCKLIANPPGYIVYACKQPKPVTSVGLLGDIGILYGYNATLFGVMQLKPTIAEGVTVIMTHFNIITLQCNAIISLC